MKYEMTKPAISSAIVSNIIIALLIGLFIFIAITFISSRHYKLSVADGTLSIKSIVYNTTISLDDIELDKVRVVNLDEENISFTVRKNGIGLPGMSIGWFWSNGSKYKVYVTDKKSVVSIPTKDGYTILFSSEKASEIVTDIQNSKKENKNG